MSDGWVPHPWQRRPDGMPRYLHGPWMEPHEIPDEHGGVIQIRACDVVGYCSAGKHAHCWQADGVEPPGHDLDDCQTAHHLRCRCDCHQAIPGEPPPEQLDLFLEAG